MIREKKIFICWFVGYLSDTDKKREGIAMT